MFALLISRFDQYEWLIKHHPNQAQHDGSIGDPGTTYSNSSGITMHKLKCSLEIDIQCRWRLYFLVPVNSITCIPRIVRITPEAVR